MVGILTRYCPLNMHNSLIGQKDQSQCDECRVEETVEHFVALCEGYGRARQCGCGHTECEGATRDGLSWSVEVCQRTGTLGKW